VKDEIHASPPPMASRIGLANTVVKRALACSCSPHSPDDTPFAVALHRGLPEGGEGKVRHLAPELRAAFDHWAEIRDVTTGVGAIASCSRAAATH
jgi:hypothetical protein